MKVILVLPALFSIISAFYFMFTNRPLLLEWTKQEVMVAWMYCILLTAYGVSNADNSNTDRRM